MYLFLNMRNFCRYARFLQAQSQLCMHFLVSVKCSTQIRLLQHARQPHQYGYMREIASYSMYSTKIFAITVNDKS